ncbi:MAG: bifunctional (p)ppGpp synthetase/guanosine-3',5'-bis(diphosphate) 3'-pyrophosphohydrolase [Armatimonadota bacterium]|nr:bifunctional (p)ppGpp synthetase/guanosine-3',5'-bis(diphosphate) 3'-pyrophosphohydrolase [Armatimonadota bacterium]
MTGETFEVPTGWEAPEALTELIDAYRAERPRADAKTIRKAYYVAEVGHKGQDRRTGEAYITHPLAVGRILVDLKMDEDSIVAGLLHDVLEDTSVTPEQIKNEFGEVVLGLVEGVTKMDIQVVTAHQHRTTIERKASAESMRKMLLAMANDFRVMVIKLADRLHNMQTLEPLSEEKRTRIAQQTLDVFAPLAGRLGIWQMKWQLEDLAFKYLHPQEFDEVSALIAKTRKERERELAGAIVMLKERMEQAGIKRVEIQGRPKHLYSIYEKMKVHGFEFDNIFDLLGIRIIVDNEGQCYQTLGIVHDLWKPIPGLIYDYISKPKSNGYQSLHTKVVGPHGDPMEVQIRTYDMHRVAEFGIAAHWQYKSKSANPKADTAEHAALSKLRQQLFDWSRDASSASEFMRSLSMDLFSHQVFAFTPKGDVIDMPAGATPLDFAFRIHSEVGLRAFQAKVNGRIVKLGHALENGDIVEVVTRPTAHPTVDWLRIAKTQNARSKIRAFLRHQSREANAKQGREALERELRDLRVTPKSVLTQEKLDDVAKSLGLRNQMELLAQVSEGFVGVTRVTNMILGLPERTKSATLRSSTDPHKQVVTEIDNVAFRRASCCYPVPGDEVMGYVSKGRGITIHRKLCPNFSNLKLTEAERVQSVSWKPKEKASFHTRLRIHTLNRQGLLADIGNIFSEANVNVSAANVRTLKDQTAVLEMSIDVSDSGHLHALILKLSGLQDVISVQRPIGRGGTKK